MTGELRRPGTAHLGALVVVLAASLAARLVGLGHGLPHVYNPDEELHFVPAAARAAAGDLDPGYFENPSGFTYVVALVLRVAFSGEDVPRLLAEDPGTVFLVARVVSALLGVGAVLAVHATASRLFDRSTGLWAAAVSGLAYLPVFYGHQALNDAATLLPVALALGACVDLHRHGRWRDALAAGGLVGVATGVKYLAAPMVLVVALAVLLRVLAGRQPPGTAVLRLTGSAVAFAAGLLALNPYMALHARQFWSEFSGQSAQAATGKLGQDGSAWVDYPLSLLWGFGTVPVALALAGVVLLARRDRALALLLITFPLVLYVHMAGQGRWFGRWLLPVYPVLAVLAGLAARRACDALARRVPARVAVCVVVVLTLGQSVVDVVRSDVLLTRTDTRQAALERVLAAVPAGSRLVVEPAVPRSYVRTLTGAGYDVLPVARPYQAYEQRLEPGLVDSLRDEGRCWVLVSGHQRERGLAAGLPGATAYYARLDAESASVFVASPFAPGAARPAFSYDFGFNYYPPAHHRPGPVMELHQLRDC